MYKEERLNRIKELISEKKQINVHELSSLLDVSVVTIRGDLKELEQEGILKRTHGGALLNDSAFQKKDNEMFCVRHDVEYDRKKEIIGDIAARFISNDDWVFLGSGTTTYYIARALLNRTSLNLLTNNLLVAYELTKNPLSNVIMTGGKLSHTTFNLGGEIFESMLQNITISRAFISLNGIDLDAAYTVSTSGEINVFKMIRKISKELFIVADSSKFDKIGFVKVGELLEADAIITDSLPAPKYVEYYSKHNIPIYYSHEAIKT